MDKPSMAIRGKACVRGAAAIETKKNRAYLVVRSTFFSSAQGHLINVELGLRTCVT